MAGVDISLFPFLFGMAFIEARIRQAAAYPSGQISLPFWEGFH